MAISILKGTPIVTESGTSGVWKYRKWSDGTAECWSMNSYTVTLTTIANYYHRGSISNIPLPTGLFNSAPIIFASNQRSSFWCEAQSMSASVIDTLNVYDVVDSTNATVYIGIHCIGTWR